MSTRQASSRLEMMQARFQQKQLQEKEQKLLQLYDQQQQRAYQVVQRASAGSNASTGSTKNQRTGSRTSITTYTTSSTQGGKVRQMFDERRQTTKGIDRSYPLEPLDNKLKKDMAMNGHSELRKKMQTKNQHSVSAKTEMRPDVNSNTNGGKQIISYHEDITCRSFATPLPGNIDERVDENQHYDNRHEAEIEKVLDTDTIQRNRMMAKIHLLDFDGSMKHRVKNDLESEQFPEDLMIDVPDKILRKNVNRTVSQSEARLERFRSQNTKKNTLPKNLTPAISKNIQERTLSTRSTAKKQDIKGSKRTDRRDDPLDERKRLINFYVQTTWKNAEDIEDYTVPPSFLVKPKTITRKERTHQENFAERRNLQSLFYPADLGICWPDMPEKSARPRPRYFCKESKRSATTFSLRPAGKILLDISTKNIMAFTRSDAPNKKSDKEVEIKERKLYRLRHGYFRETASSILKHKKKKFNNGFTTKTRISVNKKSNRTDNCCLKALENEANAAKYKNKVREKAENSVLTLAVKYNGHVTGDTDLTATSTSAHRNRLSQGYVRVESLGANEIGEDYHLRKNLLKGSMRSEEFPKKCRNTSLKRSPSVKQLRSIEDIRKSIYRVFTGHPNVQIKPSCVLTNKIRTENVMTCLEKRPRIVGRYSVPMSTLASTNYKSIKHVRNIEFQNIENNVNKRKSHLFRIVKDPSPNSSEKKVLETRVRTSSRNSESASPSKSPDTAQRNSMNGPPVKPAAFCGSERLMSKTKRSGDTVDSTKIGHIVSSPDPDNSIKSDEAKVEADLTWASSSKKKQETNEEVEPTRTMTDRRSSSASSNISNLKDKMATKTKSGARIPKTSSISSKSATDKSAISTANNLPNLLPCKICGRRFAQERIERHEQICMKTTQKKRKQFDTTMFRVKGTDLEPFVKKGMSKKQIEAKAKKPESKSNWRRKHEDFINAIRSAKHMQAHLAAGGKLSDLPPPPVSDNSDYIQCPHCGRKFNQAAAERHIPKCQHMLHNKTPNARTLLRSKR